MTIWIVTTGNSDIQLKNLDNWDRLRKKVREQVNSVNFDTPPAPKDKKPTKAPARVLGLMYAEEPKNWDDLAFPLLDSFSEKLKSANIKPTQIFLLLTNQEGEEIFPPSKKISQHCAYWQDTCTLQPLLKKYLTGKFPYATQHYLELKPKTKPGLEHWDSTLELVRETLSSLEVSKNEDIYVSHQAGTPAISSAVQFVTLGRFGKKVKFVVGNEYDPAATHIIDSSRYLRGIQVQQAKVLIQENSPGAALKLLDKIEGINSQAMSNLRDRVEIFNLNRPLGAKEEELEIQPATQRIVDALDLIEIFFSQRNYLQGITLLAAAQETFLKVAILSEIKKINETIDLNGTRTPVSQLVKWTARGLSLTETATSQNVGVQEDIVNLLMFPLGQPIWGGRPNENYEFIVSEETHKFYLPHKNHALFDWLCNLNHNFQPKARESKAWELLKWSCEKRRDSESDIRNQLLHNLRGVEEKDVVKYLLGNREKSEKEKSKELRELYTERVKQPFYEAIKFFGLPHTKEKLSKKLQAIADLIS